VLERLEECREPDRFAAWVLRIVHNRALNHVEYRRVRRAEPLDSIIEEPTHPGNEDPERDLARGELRTRLERALAQLPAAQREVLLLKDWIGLDHRAIARSLGISENLSRQRLFQARAQVRILLEKSEEPDGG